MPPDWVGAIMHSRSSTGSGTSKWVPFSAVIAASAVSCIQAFRAAVPRSLRDGSASSTATASSTVAPWPAIVAATDSCSATIRASSSTPH